MNPILTTSTAYKFARGKLDGFRKSFESPADAIKTLRGILTHESFPSDFPVVVAGIGQIDLSDDDSVPPVSEWPAVFTEKGVLTVVSFIGVRGLDTDDKKKANGAKGFAVFPVHPIDAIMADSAGAAWLWKITEKESSHVAFRGLRDAEAAVSAEALAAAAKAMPLTVSDYVEETAAASADSGAFEKIWAGFRKMLAGNPNTAPLVPVLPGKADVLKCIRSKAYAEELKPELESRNIFVWLGETIAKMADEMKAAAIESGDEDASDYDSKQLREWLATRNEKVFAAKTVPTVDLDKLDFASFMAS